MPDTFIETTRTSWLSRIAQSLMGVIFGIVFVLGAMFFLFWNEGRAIQTERSLTEGGKAAVIALAWLWYRPLVSIVVLAVGIAAGIGLHRLAARRRAARVAAPVPAA